MSDRMMFDMPQPQLAPSAAKNWFLKPQPVPFPQKNGS
jgi:hypothetical protein